jgi:hypothetical protein
MSTFDTLDDAIALAEPEGLAALAPGLAARLATVAARMAPSHPGAQRWLTVEEGADVAQVPIRRIRAWARRAGAEAWATRPTRKTLRINEAAFLAWLGRDPSLSVSNGSNRSIGGRGRLGLASIQPIRTGSSSGQR